MLNWAEWYHGHTIPNTNQSTPIGQSSVCTARSYDAHNRDVWGTTSPGGSNLGWWPSSQAIATPIIQSPPQPGYGIGHPSAIVVGSPGAWQIWLYYYYQFGGTPGQMYRVLIATTDGAGITNGVTLLNDKGAPCTNVQACGDQTSSVTAPFQVYAVDQSDGSTSYIASEIVGISNIPILVYLPSTDGLHFQLSENVLPMVTTAGPASDFAFVSDVHKHLPAPNSGMTPITLISSETDNNDYFDPIFQHIYSYPYKECVSHDEKQARFFICSSSVGVRQHARSCRHNHFQSEQHRRR